MRLGGRRARWVRWGVRLGLAGFVALNGMAWMHARAMTRFAAGGARTATIETLSPAGKVRAVALGVTVPRPQNRHTPRDVGLAYETVTLPIGDGEWLEVWTVSHPQARGVVLLFPGYATSKDSLLAPARALHARGYATVLVDFRGVGGSSGSATTLGVREATDVARATAFAREAWPGLPLVLYGVSMGGAAVLRAVAVAGVRPTAIVIESPFDSLLDTVRNRFRALGLPATPGAELLVFWGGVQGGHNAFAHNPADYARAVACPTLILHGERDPRVTGAQAGALRDALAGPTEFASFPDAGHELLITTAPQKWSVEVFGFLDRQGGAAP